MHTYIQLKVFGSKSWGHFSRNWCKSLQVNEFDEILHFAVRSKVIMGLIFFYILYSKDFTIQSNGDKERFDKEQIGVKKPFPMNNYQFTS